MVRTCCLRRLCGLGLGLAMLSSIGCQTWVPGAALTLPSPHYLEHPPQHFASSPSYPFSRELASQEATWAQPAGPAAPAPLPAPVVPRP